MARVATRVRARLIAGLCAVWLAGLAGPAGANTITLSPEEMRVIASHSATRGLSGQALQMADALLIRDPDDLQAHLIRSRAARDLGETIIAREAASRAWALSTTQDEKHAAALAMAQAHATAGRRTMAQLWLRRAAHHAPDEVSRRIAERDFNYVRSRNPWSTHLSFSVAPTSNVNNGSSQETITIEELAPGPLTLTGTALALSGIEYSAGISSRYRLSHSPRHQTALSFGASYRTYTLSDEARDIAPQAEGADYASGRVYAALSHDQLYRDGKLGLSYDLTLGRTSYGGAPLETYARLGTRLRYALGPRLAVQGGLSRQVARGEGARPDNSIWTVSAGLYGMLENRNRLGLSLSHTRAEGAADYLTYDSTRLDLQYSLAKPVWGTGLSFGLSFTDKHNPQSAYSADGRHEDSAEARVTAVFSQVDYYGFVPEATLTARRTESNISLYDSNELGLSFGIRSAF